MLTWVEVKQQAIEANIRAFRRLIGPKVAFMPVIKSNAYGHGFLEIARILSKNRSVDRLCVVSLDEAARLLKEGIQKPILILDIFELGDPKKFLAAGRGQVAFPVYTLAQAEFLDRIGERIRKKIPVHVKIDTGTSRVGVLPADARKFFKKLKNFRQLKIAGLWSHFSSSEENVVVTKKQWKILENLRDKLTREGSVLPFIHFACSAATILYPETHADGVRVGLGLYGLYPSDSCKKFIKLTPALSWYTKILQVKTVPKNTAIGYGGSYVTKKETRLAVLPVGYADGYDRKFGNKARVAVKGVRCPVRGRVCMNLTMVDVTGTKARAGDAVELLGPRVSADELAGYAGTINYEIVTRINADIPRIVT